MSMDAEDQSCSEFGENLKLDSDLEAVLKKHVTSLFSVQRLVIPAIIDDFHKYGFPPRDVCVSAPTGSGKTLCYVLPIIQYLKGRKLGRIKALIVVPVVNLAKQVFDVFRTYAEFAQLKVVLLVGGQDFSTECQNLYEKIDPDDENSESVATADIVVATPGRLLDHLRLNENRFCLKFLRVLILDEADRLIKDFRLDWLTEVENAVYKSNNEKTPSLNGIIVKRHKIVGENIANLIAAGRSPLQKILLSATLSLNVEQLKQLNLFQPRYFNISNQGSAESFSFDPNISIPEKLGECYVKCESKWKPLIVYLLLEKHDWKKVLCFVQSLETSGRLAHVLKQMGFQGVDEMTSRLNKFRADRVLARFKDGKIRIVICTDLMARGMDIEKIDCVINYDCPETISKYVHRIGRTARAGAQGVAVTLFEDSELGKYQSIIGEDERWKNVKNLEIKDDDIKKHEIRYSKALNELKTNVETKKLFEKRKRRPKRTKKVTAKEQPAKKKRIA